MSDSEPAYNRDGRSYGDGGSGRDRGDRSGYKRKEQRGDDYDDRDRRGQRGGGGGGGGGGRSYDFSEQLDVRSDCVGLIIGRAGSNIQRIQSDYNVRVDLDKGTNVVTISGNSEGNIKSALRYIQDQMDNAGSGGGGQNRYSNDSRRGGDSGSSSYRQDGERKRERTSNYDGEGSSYDGGGGRRDRY